MIKGNKSLIPQEIIENKILLIRNKKVILDRDLARLYNVTTKALKQAVKRNIERFPEDFMFKLTDKEFKNWRSQFVTSNSSDKMGLRYKPYAFTQEGIAMLSSILRSKRAIQVNIQIMRTFVLLRETLITNEILRKKIEKMEKKYDQQFQIIFKTIKKLISSSEKPKKKIGFIKEKKNK